MRAEIIAIGDELTSGQRLDTNSQWLSQRLGELGIPVAFHTTVGDDLETNVAAFRTAINRADLVVATGGLGPTADDLTRESLAVAVGVELVLDEAALAHIRGLFARRGRAMSERNVLQAQFPRGSHVVPNAHGTAPGIDLTVARECCAPCRVFALPGVPAEMFAMWSETVAPAIMASQTKRQLIRHHRIKCFGVGESDLEAMLPDMIRRKRDPLVGITVSDATITLRITASGPNEAVCSKIMEPTIAQIRELLGVLVFGDEDDEIENAVVRLLAERRQTVAVAEWGTGGLVTRWLADAVRESETFRGGIVVQDIAMLRAMFGMAAPSGDGADAETAAAMAREVREKSNANFGIGVAALPPIVSDDAETTATLHVALATVGSVLGKNLPLNTHPAIMKARAAKQVLNMLRLRLLNREA